MQTIVLLNKARITWKVQELIIIIIIIIIIINIVVKKIIHDQESDLISLNQLFYASAIISTELCTVKIKALKRHVPKKCVWQRSIKK